MSYADIKPVCCIKCQAELEVVCPNGHDTVAQSVAAASARHPDPVRDARKPQGPTGPLGPRLTPSTQGRALLDHLRTIGTPATADEVALFLGVELNSARVMLLRYYRRGWLIRIKRSLPRPAGQHAGRFWVWTYVVSETAP